MDGSCIAAIFWLCVCLSLQHRASGETVLRSVKAGANITLHCDLENIPCPALFSAGCGQCCPLLVIVCPVTALLAALLSAACVYCCCHREGSREPTVQLKKERARRRTDQREEEVNYATLEIRTGNKRVKTKPIQTSDFCIKFEVNHSTGSIDLKILNFSDSNLGFYYCATTFINKDGKDDRLRGNITTKLVYADSMSSPSPSPTPLPVGCDQCCPLLLIVCPVTALLAALLSAACGYCYGKQSGLQISQRSEAYVTQRESCVEAGGGLSVYTEVKYAQL
ncbi:hypothetical protein AAFF_G00280520 [Aldrovandia affinis]|uniref:Uncharacterized protein n=1 Tax=Aldrovandia affinis TaxID=143900 RepID=A0AAD7RA23_9TELE|nr:hypothetical protein AAFF_G00280520 [Aldrovandia affinis]